jgi:hypothetical protein
LKRVISLAAERERLATQFRQILGVHVAADDEHRQADRPKILLEGRSVLVGDAADDERRAR